MPSNYRITLSVEEDLYRALVDQSEDERRGIPDVVREAIHLYLADVNEEGVGTTAEAAIVAGKTNADALEIVLERFPRAKTTLSSIAYYRSRLRKEDNKVLTNAEAERLKASPAKKKK